VPVAVINVLDGDVGIEIIELFPELAILEPVIVIPTSRSEISEFVTRMDRPSFDGAPEA
jgi:hypothetical protein